MTLPLECTTADVAVLLRARTYSKGTPAPDPEKPFDSVAGGVLTGEFSESTRPSIAQVQEAITKAATEVRARLGQEVTDAALLAFAKDVVALRAAMTVELAYYPEQANPDDSIYEKLKELYEDALSSLVAALPDTSSTRKGIYSLRMRPEFGTVYPTDALLP